MSSIRTAPFTNESSSVWWSSGRAVYMHTAPFVDLSVHAVDGVPHKTICFIILSIYIYFNDYEMANG
ncbi:hypothetical protein TgHK011_007564 [Trichoderma gracile]|nr:hypothetical protein TgHK011_007564 [Trichoderma gracile]